VTFVGPVADVRPYMASTRTGLVPDLLGGFKLKGLDNVFNRLPIMAMRGALPGMPLEDGVSFDLFDTHVGLAEGAVSLIDSFAELNARQERAFAACADGFDWPQIGRRLMSGIEAAALRKAVKSAVSTRPLLPPPDVAALRRRTCAAHFNMARVSRPPSEPLREPPPGSEPRPVPPMPPPREPPPGPRPQGSAPGDQYPPKNRSDGDCNDVFLGGLGQ
jgi:hypothetical protein